MIKFVNITIGKKVAFVSGAGVLLLAGAVGLSLWVLSMANSASDRSHLESLKMTLATRVDGLLSQFPAAMTSVVTAKHPIREVDDVLALRKEYSGFFAQLKAASVADEDRRLLKNVEDAIVPWRELNNGIMESAKAGTHIDAVKVKAESNARYGIVRAAFSEYVAYCQKSMDDADRQRRSLTSKITYMLLGFALLTLPAAIFASIFLTRSITGPLSAAVAHLDRVAGGDLSLDVPGEYLERGDEIGLLSKSVQTMSASLRNVVKNIAGGIQVVSSSSAELSASSGQMSAGSREASEKAHSVAATAEQMTTNMVSVAAGMEQTTTNLTSVATATQQMTSTIAEIAKNSEKARHITEDARRQAARINEEMNHLGGAAREIGKVTETITEISSQTNLLALNATIEAARAGAAGKGFAVVANEIKTLAQQTAAATEDIKARIAGVQSSTAGGISEIEKVSHVIHEVGDIVRSIASAIEEQATVTNDIARNIAEASTGVRDANLRVAEGSQANQDIAREIAGVDHAARGVAEGSEQVRASANELSGVAEQLQAAVAQFRCRAADAGESRNVSAGSSLAIDPDVLQKAMTAHSAWKARLRNAIATGKLDVAAATVKADDQCQFGKWLYGTELSVQEKQSEQYRAVKELHGRFHEEASKVAQFAISGQKEAAEKAMGLSSDFTRISSDLMNVLAKCAAHPSTSAMAG